MSEQTLSRVIILGAQSAIAEACARRFAAQRARLVIVGRDQGRLNEIAADLSARGADQVHAAAVDLQKEPDPHARLRDWIDRIGGLTHVIIAHGALGDQMRAETDLVEARRIIDVNFTSAAIWALAAGAVLEQQKSGALIAIGSVAGDRGRRSNYIYGAAKAGLHTLMQGLAHRLAQAGARAVVIKPGFVDTPMTAHIARRNGPLWAKPDDIARAILRVAERKSGPVVYTPWQWRWLLLGVRALPAGLMHRTRL